MGVRHIQTNRDVVEYTSRLERVGGSRAAFRVEVGRGSIAGRLVGGRSGSTRRLMDL